MQKGCRKGAERVQRGCRQVDTNAQLVHHIKKGVSGGTRVHLGPGLGCIIGSIVNLEVDKARCHEYLSN